VKLHDPGDQAQAQAIAGLRPAFVEPYEAFDDPATIFRPYSGATVGDCDDHFIALGGSGDYHIRPFGILADAVFEGIVDEIADCLGEQLAVGADIEAGHGFQPDAAALLLGARLIKLDDIGQNLTGIDRLQALSCFARLGAGDRQERVEGLEKAVGFLDRALQGILVIGRTALA